MNGNTSRRCVKHIDTSSEVQPDASSSISGVCCSVASIWLNTPPASKRPETTSSKLASCINHDQNAEIYFQLGASRRIWCCFNPTPHCPHSAYHHATMQDHVTSQKRSLDQKLAVGQLLPAVLYSGNDLYQQRQCLRFFSREGRLPNMQAQIHQLQYRSSGPFAYRRNVAGPTPVSHPEKWHRKSPWPSWKPGYRCESVGGERLGRVSRSIGLLLRTAFLRLNTAVVG